VALRCRVRSRPQHQKRTLRTRRGIGPDSNLDPGIASWGRPVLIALLIELGSGLGPWLASPTRKRKSEAVAEPITKIERVMVKPPPAPVIEPAADDDLVKRWASDALVKRRGSFVTAREARTAFEAWCATEGVATLNPTALGKAMTALGYERNKVGGGNRYDGVALVPSQPVPLRLAVSNAPSVLGRMATVGSEKRDGIVTPDVTLA